MTASQPLTSSVKSSAATSALTQSTERRCHCGSSRATPMMVSTSDRSSSERMTAVPRLPVAPVTRTFMSSHPTRSCGAGLLIRDAVVLDAQPNAAGMGTLLRHLQHGASARLVHEDERELPGDARHVFDDRHG